MSVSPFTHLAQQGRSIRGRDKRQPKPTSENCVSSWQRIWLALVDVLGDARRDLEREGEDMWHGKVMERPWLMSLWHFLWVMFGIDCRRLPEITEQLSVIISADDYGSCFVFKRSMSIRLISTVSACIWGRLREAHCSKGLFTLTGRWERSRTDLFVVKVCLHVTDFSPFY